MKIIKNQSGYTLRVSQSRFYNRKLVQTLLEGYFILLLEGSLSRDCDVEKNDREPPFSKAPVAIHATNLSSYLDSVKSPFSHIFFFQASVNVMYLASVVDKASMCCKLAFKLPAHPNIINSYLVIDLPMA
nr:zinc finger, CCHC-type [Tanacetum cinerariifolium]